MLPNGRLWSLRPQMDVLWNQADKPLDFLGRGATASNSSRSLQESRGRLGFGGVVPSALTHTRSIAALVMLSLKNSEAEFESQLAPCSSSARNIWGNCPVPKIRNQIHERRNFCAVCAQSGRMRETEVHHSYFGGGLGNVRLG